MDIKASIRRALAALERGKQFVRHDIWHIGKPGETIPAGFYIKQLRVGILLVRGVMEETLLLRASALTFTTLLFIVPFLIFMFSFIQTFHLGDHIYGKISVWVDQRIEQVVHVVKGSGEPTEEEASDAVSDSAEGDAVANGEVVAQSTDPVNEAQEPDPQPDTEPPVPEPIPEGSTESDKRLADDILRTLFPTFFEGNTGEDLTNPIEFIMGLVEEKATDIKTLGLTGLMYILITVLGLMRNVEWSFNRIWGVTETRNLLRTFSDYFMITLLLPIVAAGMLGITAALTTNDTLGNFSIVLRSSQVLIISLTFALLYYLVPNTTVRVRCALIGGLVAGILWTLAAWAYVTFNVGLAKYTFFFSALALFPMMLAWIYLSWLILLFGALVTFAYQNEKTFALERLSQQATYAYREAVAVRLMIEMARRFAGGEAAFSVGELATEWNVPSRLIHEALEILVEAKLVTLCSTEPATYQPGRATGAICIRDVVKALREHGKDPSELRDDSAYRNLYENLAKSDAACLDASVSELVNGET
jgi:membrane protein